MIQMNKRLTPQILSARKPPLNWSLNVTDQAPLVETSNDVQRHQVGGGAIRDDSREITARQHRKDNNGAIAVLSGSAANLHRQKVADEKNSAVIGDDVGPSDFGLRL